MTRSLIKKIDRPVSAVPLADAAALSGVDVRDIEQLILSGQVFCGARSGSEFFISPAAIPEIPRLVSKHIRPLYHIGEFQRRTHLLKEASHG